MKEVEEMSRVFKEELCGACEEVCGVSRRGRGVKGTAWWTEEVKRVVEEKKYTESGWVVERMESWRDRKGKYIWRKREW